MEINKLLVRGLTRGEIKTLKAEGINLGKMLELEGEVKEAAVDKVVGTVFPDLNLDALTPAEDTQLYVDILTHTFLPAEKRKNFESPVSSASETGSGTAENAKKQVSSDNGTVQA